MVVKSLLNILIIKILQNIDYRRYKFIYRYERVLELTEDLIIPEYEGQINQAKNSLSYAFYVLDFVNEKSTAEDFYIFASENQPLEVLRN